MAEVLGDRIAQRMEELGLTQSAVARAAGLKQPSIGRLISGETRRTSHLIEIATALQTTPQFLSGEVDNPDEGDHPRPTRKMIAEQLGLTFIPKLDLNFALGSGNFVDDHVDASLELYRTEWVNRLTRGLPAKLFLTQGDGDSMIPTILDGDDVLVNQAENTITKQDQIWAVGYGDLVAIKRVRVMADGTFLLMSDNTVVPPIETNADELRVIGRVIWVGRRM